MTQPILARTMSDLPMVSGNSKSEARFSYSFLDGHLIKSLACSHKILHVFMKIKCALPKKGKDKLQ